MESDEAGSAGRAFLLIERGDPYAPRTRIGLGVDPIIIGRRSAASSPDIAFDSAFVSRRHIAIVPRTEGYVAVDQGSKNGSRLNDAVLEEGLAVPIGKGDRLSLADDAAILFFMVEEDSSTMGLGDELGGSGVDLDDARREIVVHGASMRLSGNLYALFRVLYLNRGRAVSNAEIREAVWPERARDEDGVPTAADLEINTLVMRLRKRLGESGGLVCNLRGYGYMLDID